MVSGDLDLVAIRASDNSAVFAVNMKDDPQDPGMNWSYVESDDELLALKLALAGGRCEVFLFNEAAVSVAHAAFRFRVKSGDITEFIRMIEIVDGGYGEDRRAVARNALNMWREGRAGSKVAINATGETVAAWTENDVFHARNVGGLSKLNIFSGNEGSEQEQLAVWLVDNLHPAGVIHSPQVEEGGRSRELTDLLLAYERGCFFIESKALQILGRPTLPDRKRLSRDLAKHVEKATKQLAGAVRSARRGLPVSDESGRGVEVSVDQPPHLIVLVPDLSLLSGATQFGSSFFAQFSEKNRAFFHILDPTELLRVVQAAEMIAKAGREPVTKMEAFDFYLMKRAERSMGVSDPCFHILFRS
ncbi:hypothetical protein Ate01nite_66430 [Actinoplanes teichomyceticus]|nr:hypothetical protein Ate01nite_66430 [Actinoplanes teichomyceticus]